MLINYSQMISRLLKTRLARRRKARRLRVSNGHLATETLEVRMLLAAPLVSDVLGGTTGTEITGTVYEDLNQNGAKDAGENGISGWTVYLDLDNSGTLNADAAGVPEPSATTNVDGDFVINTLQPGTYRLGEVEQPGWTPTSPMSQDVLVRQDHTSKADFFNFAGGEIVGTVWNDLDGDGARATDPITGEFTEPGLANWTVFLDLNNSLAADPGEPATLTDANGNYSFDNLPAGDYEVTEVLADGWDVARRHDVRQTAAVAALQQTTADFANQSQVNGSIQGTIWNDLNADGSRAVDPTTGKFTDPGLENWTVFLDQNNNGAPDPGEPSAVTNSDGEYAFISLPAGDYEVTEVLPDGWNVSPTFDTRQTVAVAGGTASFAQDFANFTVLNGSIRGTVWNDLNRDGVRNTTLSGTFVDPGLASWEIVLDLNRNKVKDAGEPVTLTDAAGNYSFANLQVGDYEVQEVLPTGWEVTTTYSDSQTVAVFSGTESAARDFANFNLTTAIAGTISGTVWNDINGNGVREVNASTGAFTDPGLGNRVVFADLNSNGALDASEPSATSAPDGSYTISGVLPGTVTIVEVAQAGWRATSPASGARTIALKNGEKATGFDFGNYTLQESSIHGTVFADSNHNGVRDPGERGLAGLTIYIDANGNGLLDPGELQSETSADQFFTPAVDEAGTYAFTHLPQGDYTVRAILPATLSSTPAAELTHNVTLGAAESRTGVDTAAVFRPNEIHGVKFDDANGNHQRDIGEDGVGGSTIYVDLNRNNVLDAGEPTTVTGTDGSYAFDNLIPGAYVVRELVAEGHEVTYPETVGGTLWPTGASNPAVGNVTPGSISASLASGESLRQSVSITMPNTGALTNLVDVFLLFDDTGSFVNNSPIVRAAFPTIISQLQGSLPGIDLGFGVGRFEEYASFAYEYSTGRPFILNQPIVAASTTGYMSAIQSALNRTTPGYGGDQPETDIEALYQLVTGLGFDGNNNGSVLDSGAAGQVSTQLNPGNSGDVPSFASFVADTAGGVLPAAGNVGGGGFRTGALPIILLATDTGFAYQPKGGATVTGVGGTTLPVSALSQTSRSTTPFNYGAGLQETVTALNSLGALVIGLGTNPQATLDPRQGLESLSKLTGAVNRSTTTIDNGTVDPIAPGDPLYFQIASGFAGSVSNGVVNAIQNAVTNVAVDVTVQASDPRVKIINHTGTLGSIGSGQTATFDIEFVGDGVPHRFDLQFVRSGTNVVLGSIPVVLGTPIPGNGYEFEDLPEGEIHDSVDFGSHLVSAAPVSVQSIMPVTPDPRTSAVSSIAFTFSDNVDPTTLAAADFTLTRDGGANLLTGAETITGTGKSFKINGLTNLTRFDGTYVLTLSGDGVLDLNGHSVLGTKSETWTVNGGPFVVSISPVTPNPRETALDAIDFTFSEPIDPATFSTADLVLKFNNGLNLLTGTETITPLSATSFRINGLAPLTNAGGTYAFTVNATGVQDTTGLSGIGSATATWTLKRVPPTVVAITPVKPNPTNVALDTLDVTFSEPIDPATFDLADLTLRRNNIVVPLNGSETLTHVSGNTWRIAGLSGLTNVDGRYSLTVNTVGLKDVAGVAGTTSRAVAWTEDFTSPSVRSIAKAIPNPRNTPVDSLLFTLSEAIDPTTLDLGDLQLTRGGNVIPLTAAQSLSFVSGTTWSLDGLAALTGDDGEYRFTVNASGIMDLASNAGAGAASTVWGMDTLAPVSSVIPFAAPTATSLSIVLSISGSDPAPAGGIPSGIKTYDVYVSTDGGTFLLWKTINASATTAVTKATYVAESNHSYAFHSVARDKAGNVEAKAIDVIEASVNVPDLSPPDTQVIGVDTSTPTFVVSIQGKDVGSNGVVATFDLYVSVDGSAAKKVASVPGTAGAGGVYTGQALFRAIADGASHTYRFYSIGRDGIGKTEPAPKAPADLQVSAVFDPLSVSGFGVEQGTAQRSLVRSLDVLFSRPDDVAAMVASINDGIAGNDALVLKRYTLAGASPVSVSMAGKVSAVGNEVHLDFGPAGLTTDGYYELGVDLDGNGTLDRLLHFDRLRGDFNGDGLVDAADSGLLAGALGQTGTGLPYDLNGSGLVDGTDQNALKTLLGHQLSPGLPRDA